MRHPNVSEGEDYSAWPDGLLDEDEEGGDSPSRQFAVPLEAAGGRLDKWLAVAAPDISRTRLQGLIEAGWVQVNGRPATVRQTLAPGDTVALVVQPRPEDRSFAPEPMTLAIVYEDDDLLVLNKPPGLVVHPAAGNWSGTLLNGLLHHDPALASVPRAGIVHRLDKDTSGLMVVARTEHAYQALVAALKERRVRREYWAVVHGTPPERGRLDAAIGRHRRDRVRMAAFPSGGPGTKPALTEFTTLARGAADGAAVALVLCRLQTGRTHQIRVHMQAAGFPLLGDPVYGARGTIPFGRQALHAVRLGLVHPRTGAELSFRAAPPPDWEPLCVRLGLALPEEDDLARS